MLDQIPDFNDGLNLLKSMWGNIGLSGAGQSGPLGLPSMALPTVDIEELDKRIADLKSVESWLDLNLSMLRTTIQGLEVQRSTLAAMQTFASALSPEAMQQAMDNMRARRESGAEAAPSGNPSGSAPRRENPYAASFPVKRATDDAQARDKGSDENGTESGDQAPRPFPGRSAHHEAPLLDEDADARDGADARAAAEGAAESAEGPAADAGIVALGEQANLWMNMLNQQFSRIANSAVAARQFGKTLGEPMMQPFQAAAQAVAKALEPGAGQAAAKKTVTKKTVTKKAVPKTAAKKTASKPTGAGKTAAKGMTKAVARDAEKGAAKAGSAAARAKPAAKSASAKGRR